MCDLMEAIWPQIEDKFWSLMEAALATIHFVHFWRPFHIVEISYFFMEEQAKLCGIHRRRLTDFQIYRLRPKIAQNSEEKLG